MDLLVLVGVRPACVFQVDTPATQVDVHALKSWASHPLSVPGDLILMHAGTTGAVLVYRWSREPTDTWPVAVTQEIAMIDRRGHIFVWFQDRHDCGYLCPRNQCLLKSSIGRRRRISRRSGGGGGGGGA